MTTPLKTDLSEETFIDEFVAKWLTTHPTDMRFCVKIANIRPMNTIKGSECANCPFYLNNDLEAEVKVCDPL